MRMKEDKGGGVKITKFLQTSFMDGPISDKVPSSLTVKPTVIMPTSQKCTVFVSITQSNNNSLC